MSVPERSSESPRDAAGPDDDVARLGRVLGDRYRLASVIARGSMGTVYAAEHVSLARPMAVKVMRRFALADPTAAERFDREAQAMSRLRHENCVEVIDYGTTDDGTKYLVMPLYDGPCLRELAGGPMPVRRAIDLVVQILEGLDHAHRRGLVHRDLKPDNVIVVRGDNGRETATIVDFGLARVVVGGGPRLTSAGIVYGTPAYMSPEQAAGGTAAPSTDLYAAGVILYELLAGHPPFESHDTKALARMHLAATPPPLPDAVPAGIAAIVQRLMAKRPGDRFDTARAAADALRTAMTTGDEQPPRAAAESAAQPSMRATKVDDSLPKLALLDPALQADRIAPANGPSVTPTHGRKLWVATALGLARIGRIEWFTPDHALVKEPRAVRLRRRRRRIALGFVVIAIAVVIAVFVLAP